MILHSCPSCQTKLKVKDELAGKKVRCPQCKQTTDIPAAIEPLKPSFTEDATLPPSPVSFDEVATIPPQPPAASDAVAEPKPERNGDATDEEPREALEAAAHYEVEGEIARGGMGVIMRAVDQDIRREVAVKFLLNHADEKMKARFVEEAQITGQLEHPNIVPIHQLGVHQDGRCFFSMKMVNGHSLAEILKVQSEPRPSGSGNTYTLIRLLNIFVSICNAIAYAHSRQVIHRDLKPANVMVGDFGEVYVMDWGLAKVLTPQEPLIVLAGNSGTRPGRTRPHVGDSTAPGSESGSTKVATSRDSADNLTQAGAIMGTPAYMPPEQAVATGVVDERSDIYSLGAILYEIMTLTPPVGYGGDMLAILVRVVEGQIDLPEKRSPQRMRAGWGPPELSAIAMKALATDPADRYQTADALRRDIERYLEGRSVSAKQDSAWEMAKKFVKRNKGLSAATAVALVVLTVVVGFFLQANYAARIRAEGEERKAIKANEDFKRSQAEKEQAVRDSLPAFVGAGQLLANEGKFREAQKQVEVALVYDPDNAAAHLLKGQILLVQKDWPQARAELARYLKRRPKDQAAHDLLTLSQKDMKDPAVLFDLAQVLGSQKLYGLAGALTKDIQVGVDTRKPLLKLYQQQIEATWPNLGNQLSLLPNGQLQLILNNKKQVATVQPLRNMQLHRLGLQDCPITDIEPLRGMPLTFLDLAYCSRIEDFRPLEKMPLTELSLQSCQIADLEPLRGMRLSKLMMNSCRKVADLSPLEGMPLKVLDLTACVNVADLRPLRGMSQLQDLIVSSGKISDLEPLRDLPLQSLRIGGYTGRSLEPLRQLPLKVLDLNSNYALEDLRPLKGLPLTELDIWRCPKIHDLTPLDGMKLQTIALNPKYIENGMEVLRRMKSLKSVTADQQAFPADVFWKKYDAGEFKK